MEDYDAFVQLRLSLRKSEEEEHSAPPPASSLIRFYGRAILPPLLGGKQREEMQGHRDAAQRAAVQNKLKDDSRMAYVQTILHSVQLRKTPTLEELLHESEINTTSSYSHNTIGGAVSQSNSFIGTTYSNLLSSPPGRKEKEDVSLPPLTSTTYSAFFASNVTPQQSYQEECLIDQHYSQQGSQPIHQSVSSGYVTYENVENTTSVSGRIVAERESHGFTSFEEAYNNNNNMDGFFLHNTSNTIAKMPDIINYPPIDGEELERSGLESSFCNNLIVVQDICCTLLKEDSVICYPSRVENSESSHLDSKEGGDNLPFSTVLDVDKDHNVDRIDGPVSSSENSGLTDNLELSQTLSTHHSPTPELHIQHDSTESDPADNHVDEANPSEEPYRLSLQALLKKSQEYRRRQRTLRNQAKNTRIQERTHEQTRAEERSLSDKENDEFPDKRTMTTEGETTKESRGTFILSVETSPKKSWKNERMFELESNFKSDSTHLPGDGHSKEMTAVEEETIFKNNNLNISQEVITEPKQISTFLLQQPTLTETSSVQEAFYLTTCPAAFSNGVGKYHSIPAPNLCRSPVYCKRKGSIHDGESLDGAKTLKKVLVETGLVEDHKAEEVNLGCNSPTAVPPTVNLMVEGDVTSVSAKNSQHIDQLESNLSSLKVLISDLESTLTKNLENHDQTESDTQSKLSFKGIEHSCQRDCDYCTDKVRDDDDHSNDAEQDNGYREWQRRLSSDNFNKMQEDTGPELSRCDTDDDTLIVQLKETEAVNVTELRLVKTLATERGKEQGTCGEGLTKTYGQHGGSRKPTAKCIVSVTQRLRIPDVFRNAPSATAALRNVSVFSDTSNRPVESRTGTAGESHDSTQSPSLNQSYDVNAPSGLWLLEGSGSDRGPKGHLVQENHLTPESGAEGQGGASKVKRRLLMHMTEETRDRSAGASRVAGSVVRPNSSTPRAAVPWYEGHGGQEDKQEELKQAHAAQVRALQDEHRRQQEELLQALAVHYRHLQSGSFPCSMSSSHFGDKLTSSTLSQPSSSLSELYRPLLLAAVKGFLARRLLKTERVAQLVRTIRDTSQFLLALQRQSPGRGEFSSRQDLLLQERVTLQLRAARFEVHDIFFSLSAGERMELISWDRELAKERELRRQSGYTGHLRGKSSLSTATQKSLERKRRIMIQKKVAERHTGVVTRTGHNTRFSAEQPPETKRGQFRTNPQRIPKSTCSSRPR
ncbi:uncharacterized protein si:ch73-100l22.3 [Cyclopterus lumpus]|uniref:Centriolar coiled coil protein 110kDa n=1 Tax=Cyclopterus lumpus TaxID=8103 RepID=A0A8C2ZNZ2_CYCLU|nr:uncharacterized protein si:ch73-100l22.3 [Cyclopterus lumpus]XP_034389097.1 uncharacterized protein si:ch73-100l22.3 [Cyclopterus lumpus]